jgi:hypothetical protein
MNEIKTTQFSWTANELVIARQITNKGISWKNMLIFVLIYYLILLCGISPLIVAAIFLPHDRAGFIPFLLSFWKNDSYILWPPVAFLVLENILVPLFVRYRVWRSFQANKKLFRDIEIHFNEQGIDWIRPNAISHSDWSNFQSVIDHKNFFLIGYGSNLFYSIPKRALSESQIPALTEMLKSHISRYSFRK